MMMAMVMIGSTNAVEAATSEFNAQAHGSVMQSGACGAQAKFKFYSDGMVYIYGSGKMYEETMGFALNESVREVYIEETITSIGSGEFAACSNLRKATIKNKDITFGNGAFVECPNVVLYAEAGSTAEAYAKKQGLSFVAVVTAVKGDLDGNSKVELADAQTTLKAALKITTLDATANKAADVNGDGQVNLSDAQMILKYALKIINSFS